MSWNVGLIGLDGHQGQILDGIVQLEHTRLVGIASRNAEALERTKSHPAVTSETHFYSDHREMLEREKLHIVGICNMNSEHAPVLLDGAGAGVHMVSEKPLVTTLEDLNTVQSAVERSRVTLSMLLTMRFEPAYLAAKALVGQGKIGKPILASAQKSYRLGGRPEWMKHRSTYGGTIPFVGIHALDLIRWITGQEFTEAFAYHANIGKPEVKEMEDNATVVVKLEDGGSASAHIDYLRPTAAPTHGDDAVRVAGSEGVVEVRYGKTTLIDAEGGPREIDLPEPIQCFVNFVESLEGKTKRLVPAEDAYRMTEICLKARDAADTGRPVVL